MLSCLVFSPRLRGFLPSSLRCSQGRCRRRTACCLRDNTGPRRRDGGGEEEEGATVGGGSGGTCRRYNTGCPAAVETDLVVPGGFQQRTENLVCLPTMNFEQLFFQDMGEHPAHFFKIGGESGRSEARTQQYLWAVRCSLAVGWRRRRPNHCMPRRG